MEETFILKLFGKCIDWHFRLVKRLDQNESWCIGGERH